MEEVQAPPAPMVPTRSLPEAPDDIAEITPRSLPKPLPPLSPSPPVAGPSSSPLKRSRWFEDESGDETDEFIPQARKKSRAGRRSKAGPLKRVNSKLEGKGTKCNLCGKHLGRVTDLPRHKASCKWNPERATRKTPCEICGKLLPGNSIITLSVNVFLHYPVHSPCGCRQTTPLIQKLSFQTEEGRWPVPVGILVATRSPQKKVFLFFDFRNI